MATELELKIYDEVTGTDRTVRVSRPFALIGPGPNADVQLRTGHPNQSNHIYLQATDRGLVSVKLTAGGTWTSRSPVSPVLLGRKGRIRVSNYIVSAKQCGGSEAVSTQVSGGGGSTRLANGPGTDGLLNFRNGCFGAWKHPRFHLQEHLTLIGSSERCHIRLEHPDIPEFHSSIVRLNGGFLAVALSGDLELVVNQRQVRSARLDSHDELTIGPFRVRFEHETAQDSGAESRRDLVNLPSENREPLESLLHSDALLQNSVGTLDTNLSSSDTLSLIQQLTAVNCMLLQQSQQQTALLSQLIQQVQSLPKTDQSLMREQISAIHAVAKEIRDLRRQRGAGSRNQLTSDSPEVAALPDPTSARLEHDPALTPLPTPKSRQDIDAHAALSQRIRDLEGERQNAVVRLLRSVLGRTSDLAGD